MDFATVQNSKAAAKTVAITLTNDEARNPANAFAALLNMTSGVRFSVGEGLSTAENQFMRANAKRDADPAPKPKTESDAKPKDDVTSVDEPHEDTTEQAAATNKSEQSDDHASTDSKAATQTTETQPTEQTAAVALEALQSVAIQFQIFVQMPNGALQDMGTFDLKSLLAAASQNSELASALEAAFGQAAAAIAKGQPLIPGVAQENNLTPELTAALQQAGLTTPDATADKAVADVFSQIAAAFRPLAQEAAKQQQTATNTPALAAQNGQPNAKQTVDAAKAAAVIEDPEAARQSAELSKIFGDDHKMRIQVAVDGRKVADMPFEFSSFNRFAGYNPAAMRTMSTANGQAGQGQATNALLGGETQAPTAAPSAPTPVAAPVAAPNAAQAPVLPQSGQALKADVAPVRAPEATAPANTTANGNSASSGQTNSFASALSQATGNNTAAAQTSSAERPAPTQPQQVIEQIKVNITRAAKAGLDKVTIALRPEELGRIEIKLEMTQDGQVRANVTADNPATLELLQREARGLERALQDAGLNADASDLEFNLRSEDQDRLAEQNDQRGQGGRSSGNNAQSAVAANENEESYDYQRAASMRGGVDTYA